MIGRTLSHYKVLEEISRGGMGIVYKALDLKLNREVALKVLPPELVSDPDRKRRFIQEAQAAAAIKHPNIATIYEIDEVDGVDFIAMELIEGEQLSDILSRGALSPERTLDLARDVANGLAKAHEKRIVHRDLKPANIMVTEEGVPKIIDFGLAKLLEPLEADSAVETAIRQQTQIGQLLGTVSYMSPEQARGQAVDARSDVFSFGVMLYEMVTGSVPFEAPSSAEVLNAIIHAPLPHGAREISPKLHRVIDKCTAKNPDDRYPTGVALLADLQKLSQPAPRVASTRSYIALTIGAAVLIASGLSLISNRETDVGDGVPRLTNPIQLTRALGVENYPAWSPDGTTLAYVSRVEESQDIWMVAASGGEPVNLTPSFEGNEFAPSWSPDGRQIAFGSESEGGGCFVMSVEGDAAPLKVASLPTNFILSRPQWSRDGKELACVVIDARGAAVEIVSLEAAISRRIPLAGRQNLRLDLAWSPDERFFAYVDAVNDLSEITQLWVTRVSDGESFAITEERTEDWSPSWSLKGGSLFFVSNRGGTFDLWQQHMAQDGSPVGEPQRVTAGLGMRQAVFSRDGRRLAYSRGARVGNVWRVPILSDREATWADATQITFDQALVDTFDLSHDGERLVVASNRSGNADLWLVPAEGGEMLQLTTDPTPDWVPGWSPDGMSVVFYSYRSGNRDVWIVDIGTRSFRQLTTHGAIDMAPTWSPDGRDIAFNSARTGNNEIWVVPADGGEPRQLTEHPAVDWVPRWSGDGELIYFHSTRSGEHNIWRVPAAGGEATRITHRPTRWLCPSEDGQTIFFTTTTGRNIWAHSLTDGTERRVTDFSAKRGSLYTALETDGENLYFSWGDDLGDLWVMDVVTDE